MYKMFMRLTGNRIISNVYQATTALAYCAVKCSKRLATRKPSLLGVFPAVYGARCTTAWPRLCLDVGDSTESIRVDVLPFLYQPDCGVHPRRGNPRRSAY